MVSFHEVAYEVQTSQPGNLSSINMKTITSLAETFLMNPEENLAWLISSSYDFESWKTLFFLMLMQSFMMHNSTFSLHFYFFSASTQMLLIPCRCGIPQHNHWFAMFTLLSSN